MKFQSCLSVCNPGFISLCLKPAYDCVLCMLIYWTENNGAYGIVNLKLGVYEDMAAVGDSKVHVFINSLPPSCQVQELSPLKSGTCGSLILYPTWLGSVLILVHVCFIVVLPLDGENLAYSKLLL
ncbi:disease resistance protein RPM1-like protein [Corchorus olitorius]|uniref:Disease resistance protein RPM1-like protein n=1 Tax=Corchorus olitorius TaxID=93759 RepID=A0A1R3KWR6_9ROSI|nr:disease resistance protein RPM1-like protein [Corchorus olitorius]